MLDTFAPSSAIAAALVATFTTVFLAEVAGDKLIYTAGVLVTRYRLAPVIVGVTLAFGAKMAVAVVVGRAIGALPRAALAAATVAAFAWVVWQMSRETEETTTVAQAGSGARTVVVSFTSVFFTEWGDPGQLAAAALAADIGRPLVVWSGAVLAMLAKAAIGAFVSAGLMRHVRHRLPSTGVRYGRVAVMIAVGVWSLAEVWTRKELPR
jgi:putative Ca2+/H+ antiporter (TMEM165/GDT1 family)